MMEYNKLNSPLLNEAFPYLDKSKYTVTSCPSSKYNCISWAAGDDTRIWWPNEEKYWPLPCLSNLMTPTAEHIAEAFIKTQNYTKCDDGNFEKTFQKLAIYTKNGLFQHIARQLENATWASKLGRGVDIIHHTLEILEGNEYGKVTYFLKRPI